MAHGTCQAAIDGRAATFDPKCQPGVGDRVAISTPVRKGAPPRREARSLRTTPLALKLRAQKGRTPCGFERLSSLCPWSLAWQQQVWPCRAEMERPAAVAAPTPTSPAPAPWWPDRVIAPA